MSASKEHTVWWWIGWIALTILSFFLSHWFWTPVIARHVGPMSRGGVPLIWVGAVFGTWMVMLVPLIIVMYNKVDRAYDESREAREKRAVELLASRFPVPSLEVEEAKLLLPAALKRKLKRLPKTLKQGQLVRLEFKDGRRLENVFVFGGEEIVGVYGRKDFPFDAREAVAFEMMDPAQSQPVEYAQWLRLKNSG